MKNYALEVEVLLDATVLAWQAASSNSVLVVLAALLLPVAWPGHSVSRFI